MFILLNTSHINGNERQLGRVLEILREKGWRVAPGNPETWPLSIEDREIFERHLEEASQQARSELVVASAEKSTDLGEAKLMADAWGKFGRQFSFVRRQLYRAKHASPLAASIFF